MLRIRLIEEAIAIEYPKGKMRCPIHLSIGQEAVASGISAVLKPEDKVVSTHRAHAHYLAKGGDLRGLICELYGKERGCSGGRGGSMHLIDLNVGFCGSTAIVGNTIPIGVGLAYAEKMAVSNNIVCIYMGDAAIEEGVFYESLNFSVLHGLPVLFICENNMYSVYTSMKERQPKGREIQSIAKGIGAASITADGNDANIVREIAEDSIDKCREGHGPFFLEFFTYRWREHCGPNYDNDIGYRSEKEFSEWKEKDPIKRQLDRLMRFHEFKESDVKVIAKDIQDEIDFEISFATRQSYANPENASLNVFRTLS